MEELERYLDILQTINNLPDGKANDPISIMLKKEVNKQIRFRETKYALALDRNNGLFKVMINDDQTEIKDWLEANLKNRFSISHDEFFSVVDFGKDKEAAALYKMFWENND